jgi:hypothetical protein
MPVPGDDPSTESCGDDPGLSSHVDYLPIGAEEDPAEGTVTGERSELADGEELSVLGLMEPTGYAL